MTRKKSQISVLSTTRRKLAKQSDGIRLRAGLPGRERWEVPPIHRRSGLAAQVEEAVGAEPGVVEARANPLTGRVLVVYDCGQSEGSIERTIRRVLASSAPTERTKEPEQLGGLQDPLLEVLSHASPQTRVLAKATAWTVVTTLASFLPAWGLSSILDVRRAGKSADASGGHLSLLGIVTAVLNAAEWIIRHHQRKLWRDFASSAEHALRTRTFAHVEKLDMAFFDKENTGQLQSVLANDITAVGRFIENGPSKAIQHGLTVALCMGSLAFLSPTIALMAAVPGVLVLLTARYFQKKISPLYAQYGADSAELNRLLANCLAGIATTKSFTAEQDEVERIDRMGERLRKSHDEAIGASSANGSFMHGLVYSTVSSLTLTMGAVLASRGRILHKSLMTISQLVPKLFAATSQIDDLYETYMDAALSSERILLLLRTEPTTVDGKLHLDPSTIEGRISYEGVSFGYRPDNQILRDINLEIRPGQTVGIVGATGAGKTTLVKLLLRFYDRDGGAIRIDDTDVRSFSVQDLRRAIAFVSQDVYLFDGTIYDNIAYGCPTAPRDRVVEAARTADADTFIRELPDGYETQVGERGRLLSMGQRQRISIARAVVKDAPILVLDEATASVDNETEAAIHRSIERVAVGRSMVVIAHRLSTVRNASCIYVVDKGIVVERGTHDELLETGGLYSTLWNVQTGNLAANEPPSEGES